MTVRKKFCLFLALTVVSMLLSNTKAYSMISASRASWLDLYKGKAWVYQNVGAPDSVDWNSNLGTNLENYRISNSPSFDSTFVGYGGDGIIHVMGQIYRPGVTNISEVCRMIENQGGVLTRSNWGGRAYRMKHINTGRTVYAVVESNANLGPVLYILTPEGWNSLN